MIKSTSTVRTLTGTVSSDKMNKSIVVLVARQIMHPKYKKYIRRTTKIHAHDESNQAKTGDTVIIRECRPISKTKRWTLHEVTQKVSEK